MVVQEQVTSYIRLQYPNVVFKCDLNGVNLGMLLYMKLRKLGNKRGHPDLVIYEARKGYNGLFLELKKDGFKLLKKNGDFVNEHIKEQAEYLKSLNNKGYLAVFACGFDEAKRILDGYLR